jgi:hypothetical protein
MKRMDEEVRHDRAEEPKDECNGSQRKDRNQVPAVEVGRLA